MKMLDIVGKKKGAGRGKWKAKDRGGWIKPDMRKLRSKKRKKK